MSLKAENLKPGDLLRIKQNCLDKKTITWAANNKIDLATPFTYVYFDRLIAGKEVVSLSYEDKEGVEKENLQYLDDFELYVETQDNDFVQMMSSNERMLDLPI